MYHLAIDIGASSGRHILGKIEGGKIITEEIYRFDNVQIKKNGHICWDLEHLFSEILNGIKRCGEIGKKPATMAIDTWGFDNVLQDEKGALLSDAGAYRDKRTEGVREELEKYLPFEKLYAVTGIQYQPFNTVYQLAAQKKEQLEQIAAAARLLMIPEYFNFLLTGKMMNEYTNATTTSLVDAKSRTLSKEILDKIGIPHKLFGELHMPGEAVGYFTDKVRERVGFDCKVVLAASHDTASAFMAVPAENEASVYISSGTWSLLGVENAEPITDSESRKANFTNEGGYGFRYRYLKNIMGLWMLQSIRRELNKTEEVYSFDKLIAMARECADFSSVVDVDKEVFLAPKSMIEAVNRECERTGQKVPASVGETVQCVYRSLAKKYAEAIEQLEVLTGKKYTSINIVGGGCRDMYLNRLTAEETGLRVTAGPVEGTALGNLCAQLIAEGEIQNLSEARSLIRSSFDIITV